MHRMTKQLFLKLFYLIDKFNYLWISYIHVLQNLFKNNE